MDFPKPLARGSLPITGKVPTGILVVPQGIEPRTHPNQGCTSPFGLGTIWFIKEP